MNLKYIVDVSSERYSRASKKAYSLGRNSQGNKFAKAAGDALTRELRALRFNLKNHEDMQLLESVGIPMNAVKSADTDGDNIVTVQDLQISSEVHEASVADLVEALSYSGNDDVYSVDTSYTYFPQTREELIALIDELIKKRGNNGDFNDIDTSKITDMSFLFVDFHDFNGDISEWDVSNVTNMKCMFADSERFNRPVGKWNVSNVTSMESMFDNAKIFNQDISDWDVYNVTNMDFMFASTIFNKDISQWDVSKVRSMRGMFTCSFFNRPIGTWNVSAVTDMSDMFNKAYRFNKDISNWDVSEFCDTNSMFLDCNIKEAYKPQVI